MSKALVTRYKTTATGQGRIEGRLGNVRRVVPFDHSQSIPENHAEAAAAVIVALNLTSAVLLAFARGEVGHEAGNGVHRFYL